MYLHGVLIKTNQPSANSPSKYINFHGDDWVLRLIHTLFDFHDAREAMLKQHTSMSRQELDRHQNPMVTRRNAYQIIANNYNDSVWGFFTTTYPNLHPEYASEKYIKWEDVRSFGSMDEMKAKNKLTSMACKLNIIKANYEASGNGVGNRVAGQSDEVHDSDKLPELGRADDRMNFLNGER